MDIRNRREEREEKEEGDRGDRKRGKGGREGREEEREGRKERREERGKGGRREVKEGTLVPRHSKESEGALCAHCLRMHKVPLVTCILHHCTEKITIAVLLSERLNCKVMLLMRHSC